MLFLALPAFACDTAALRELLDAPDAPMAPALRRACPQAYALKPVFRLPEAPEADLQAATAQPRAWSRVCPGGFEALSDGFEPVTAGQRATMWSACELERIDLFDRAEWITAPGPPASTLLLIPLLAKTALTPEEQRRLVRRWAQIPDPVEPEVAPVTAPIDPLDPAAEQLPIQLVRVAEVKWPPQATAEDFCEVDLHILGTGVPGNIVYARCDESLRKHVESAIEASWFVPASRGGNPIPDAIRMRYQPSMSPTVVPRVPIEPDAPIVPFE